MKIVRNINEIKLDSCALAIGNFDGIHLGHQKLINMMSAKAKEKDIPSVILSFYNHPLVFINRIRDYYITCPEEKIAILEDMDVDILVIPDFDEKFMNMTPDEFIQLIRSQLNPENIVVGKNFNFGHARKGDPNTLIDHFGKKVEVIEPVRYEDVKISSTLIRSRIKKGYLKKAAKLLGRNFFIDSKVRSGKKIGRDLEAPTINFNMDKTRKILPPSGVYISKVHYDDTISYGITNIGGAPTLDSFDDKCIETHIFDNEIKTMYNKQVRVELLLFLREEIRFKDISELKQKIKEDIQQAKKIIRNWGRDEKNNNHHHHNDDDANHKFTGS